MEDLAGREAELRPDNPPKVNPHGIEELVTDKGYHSGAVVKRVKSYEVRSYIPEKKQKGRRNWQGKAEQQQAVYHNRRRVRGNYGKSLLRRRGELVERSFAHCYQTGGLRRTYPRGHQNILKRQLIYVGAFNLSLILRKKWRELCVRPCVPDNPILSLRYEMGRFQITRNDEHSKTLLYQGDEHIRGRWLDFRFTTR